MNVNRLYKQGCAFERRALQLDTHNDAMSSIDWNKLSDKLAADTDLETDELLLKPNERQLSHVIDEKSNWVIDINPLLFLDMTTFGLAHIQEILDASQPLDVYQSPKAQQNMVVHPSLSINKVTGQIEGHEGRHRAAAVHKAGGKWYRLSIKLVNSESRNHGINAMPWIWLGQFNGKRFDIKNLIDQGQIKVLNTTVQKDYWR